MYQHDLYIRFIDKNDQHESIFLECALTYLSGKIASVDSLLFDL